MCCIHLLHRTVAIPVYAKPQISYHEVSQILCVDRIRKNSGIFDVHNIDSMNIKVLLFLDFNNPKNHVYGSWDHVTKFTVPFT